MSILHLLIGAGVGYWYGSSRAKASEMPDGYIEETSGEADLTIDEVPEAAVIVPLPVGPARIVSDLGRLVPRLAVTPRRTFAPGGMKEPHGTDRLDTSERQTMRGYMDPWGYPAYYPLTCPFRRGVEQSTQVRNLSETLDRVSVSRLRRRWLPSRFGGVR